MNRRYSELIKLPTLEARFDYLKLNGKVGKETFGVDRYLNQILYHSKQWEEIRDYVAVRDDGLDLGMEGHDISGVIYVHHMNPILLKDLLQFNPDVLNPEYLISCSFRTHQAIHYGNFDLVPKLPKERTPGDTCPWR